MAAGAAVVAVEAFARNEVLARRAVEPSPLFPFEPPPETFARGLVRKAVTPVGEFYAMSKNAVDPVVDPHTWRLRISHDGRTLREFSYAELLTLPRTVRYVTLRCISNTLQSDLMGNAAWSGIRLRQLVPVFPPALEVAFIGVDGHGDSLPVEYAISDEAVLALGMNGNTLHRTHGFPVRLLAPRYYGFKNIKWIGEIAFVTKPYAGTWPAMGWEKEARIHTASHIDRVVRQGPKMLVGGVSFAGSRGIRAVEVRGGDGEWRPALLEPPLSPYAWTRWRAETLPADRVEARAMDGEGRRQAPEATGMFPSGVSGPTVKRL
jgi:DMSO/TMAO reductase YedYZ molybdopterin-dependent catalytic subunit